MSLIGRRQLTTMIGATLAAPVVLRHAIAAPEVHLKMVMADVVSHPVYPVLLGFAEDVLHRTNGAVKIKVYGAGQLGSEQNALTSMQNGIVDLVCHTTGFIETIYPTVAVLDLPYIFKTDAEAEKVLDGPIGQKLFDLFPAKGIVGLCWGSWGWRLVTSTKPPVPEPKDIKGLKIRIQPGAIYADTYKTLGAVPAVIDATEVYLALSEHAVDATEVPLISVIANKFYEIAKHVTETNFNYNPGVVMASKHTMDRLEKNHQTAIREAAAALSPVWRKQMTKASDDAVGFMKSKGCTFTPADEAAYTQAFQPVYARYRPIVGADLLESIEKQTGRAV